MKSLTQAQLNDMLAKHEQWLNGPKRFFGLIRSGKRADFSGMLLKDLNFGSEYLNKPGFLNKAIFKDTVVCDCDIQDTGWVYALKGVTFTKEWMLETVLIGRVTREVGQKEVDRMLQRHEIWRQQKPLFFGLGRAGKRADFRGLSLTEGIGGVNLTGKDLRDVIFSDGERFAVLHGADLSQADLTGVNLQNVRMGSATMYRTNLTSADLRRADLTLANLWLAQAPGAKMDGCSLDGAILQDTNLRDASLINATLPRDLHGTILVSAKLDGTGVDQTSAPRAVFTERHQVNAEPAVGTRSKSLEKPRQMAPQKYRPGARKSAEIGIS